MKTRIAAALAGLIAVTSALDFPSIQVVEETRKPGTPYLHPPAKVLLGKLALKSDREAIGCSDSATASNCT